MKGGSNVMRENVSFSFGPIALINKIENKFNFFE